MISKNKANCHFFSFVSSFNRDQSYIFVKSYQLKEKEVYQTIQTGLTNITQELEDRGVIKKISSDLLQHIFIKYNNQDISKQEIYLFLKIVEITIRENSANI